MRFHRVLAILVPVAGMTGTAAAPVSVDDMILMNCFDCMSCGISEASHYDPQPMPPAGDNTDWTASHYPCYDWSCGAWHDDNCSVLSPKDPSLDDLVRMVSDGNIDHARKLAKTYPQVVSIDRKGNAVQVLSCDRTIYAYIPFDGSTAEAHPGE
jgi:hypothetical protein